MPLKSTTPKALAEIFDSPSDDEDFPGFGVAPPGECSEDSRDSLYSGDSSKLRFKSKFITTDLAHLFSQSDSEGKEFEGFSEEDVERERFSQRLKTLHLQQADLEDSEGDTGFYSDGEDAAPPKKRSLCVALRFPTKRLSAPIQTVPEKKAKKTITAPPPPSRRTSQRMKQKKEEEEENEEEEKEEKEKKGKKKKEEKEEEENEEDDKGLSQSLSKRDKNIKENKAMLAKLFADLSTMAELTPLHSPQKKRRTPATASPRKRKSEPEAGSERRNPSRKARPPEHFGKEEKSTSPSREPRGPRTVDIRRLVEVDEDLFEAGGKRRRSQGVRRSRYVVKSVDEITEEDLDNIAYRSKDKIWDKENGSSCHQCRQKTLDTKTVCRSGFCAGGKGQFCGPCLKNRYGEEVRKVLLDPTWSCPLCRGMCNCSLCRKREGRCATGILVGLARYNGHNNVHQYLESIQKELEES